jgi:hypothetical protein
MDNAFVDARFGLDHWPLFNVGSGNAPLPPSPHAPASGNYDEGTRNVRSDSLVRWMAYAAVAFGAKGLNWYCWGGGVYWQQGCNGCNTSLPGLPTPTYATVREVNADAAKWGDLSHGRCADAVMQTPRYISFVVVQMSIQIIRRASK